jgi:hypothetical protein
MAQEDLDALLSRMDAIAKAVNAFTSETVQQEAFSALVAAFEGKRHSGKHGHTPPAEVEPESPEVPALTQYIRRSFHTAINASRCFST